jgi:hypothetical protein
MPQYPLCYYPNSVKYIPFSPSNLSYFILPTHPIMHAVFKSPIHIFCPPPLIFSPLRILIINA